MATKLSPEAMTVPKRIRESCLSAERRSARLSFVLVAKLVPAHQVTAA